ncbi:MAG TPA: type II toxin-antitoxin system RelE/ParE family toxin [Tepidisphaeraceae bacterium]|nr:type II toxin-antitoxin system RelE/ParE family toxin [Tepidisphaeraceae bacterium]
MPRPIGFHPAALAEAVAAAAWYRERSVKAAAAFEAEIAHAMERIAAAPDRYPPYVDESRRILLRRFPFAIIYRLNADRIEIVAVAHGRRRPGYWRNR